MEDVPDHAHIVYEPSEDFVWYEPSEDEWKLVTQASDWYNYCLTQTRPIRDDFVQFRVQFVFKGEYEDAVKFLNKLKQYIRTEKVKK
jgi:hypothetical protein